VHGRGPFATPASQENALSIQLLFTTVAVTQLSLAAVIRERKRVQEAAREKGEQLQLALDAAQMNTWDWRLPEVNKWLEASHNVLYHPTADAVIAFEGFSGLIHPADLFDVSGAIEKSTARAEPLNVEFRVVRPDGSIRWHLAKGKVLFDNDRRPIRMVGLTADITDRKMAETLSAGENRILEMIATGAQLKEILASLAALVEAESTGLLCAVMLLDSDGVHVRHGAAPSLPLGYVKAVEGAQIGPRAGSCGTAMYLRQRIIASDVMEDSRWEDYRELAMSYGLRACWSTPIVSEHGKVLGSFAMYYREPRTPTNDEVRLIDIATQLAAIAIERKRAEVEVLEQRRELAHLGRVAMVGELSGALAHELTQPLTAVLSNAQAAQRLITRNPPDLVEVREILADIVAADRRATEVIHRLRTMLVKGHTQTTPLDLNEVTMETLKLARGDLAAREVSVALQTEARLPHVMGDRVQLQQVVLNLIINACDAMSTVQPAQRKLSISTRSVDEGRSVELAVEDRGTGLAQHLVDRIFDPFFTSKEHGLGLGLSICRSIIRAHHGQLTGVNNAESGATFTIQLPTM
jgi:signal transduction histidine kinase